MLTGLLFGQDVLYLKSGELKKGVFIEKLDNDIVFQIEGESKYTRFSIDLVEIIETNNRAIFYPFDIPTKKEYPSKGWSGGYSIGYSSEKIGVSFYNVSLLNDIDEHSELFGSFFSAVFLSGIGLGYKYYIEGKSKSSMFVNTGAQIYVMGENHTVDAVLNTAAGLSLKKTGGKTSFNIGISLLFPVEEIIPFINLQRRL